MTSELNTLTNSVEVSVQPHYLDEQSDPDSAKYVFAYKVEVCNFGSESIQLLARHWIITDGNNSVREVIGEGVVGEQPHIEPGQCYQYSSGAILSTKTGTMEGSYKMRAKSGIVFDAMIETFALVHPHSLQ